MTEGERPSTPRRSSFVPAVALGVALERRTMTFEMSNIAIVARYLDKRSRIFYFRTLYPRLPEAGIQREQETRVPDCIHSEKIRVARKQEI